MKLSFLLFGLAVFTAGALAEDVVTLPGTQPLTMTGDLSAQMHEAALRDMDKKIADSPAGRAKFWHRDVSSLEAYEKSITGNRERFRKIIGLADARVPVTMERFGDDANPPLVAETAAYRVWQVRWPVLEGVHGEGLLLEPQGKKVGIVVALPDADQTPEQCAGLAPGIPAEAQFARRLAENGFSVLVPVLVDRGTAGSGDPSLLMTNEPHREWIHRQASVMGRTMIGYEVQKVLAAVDWAAPQNLPIGVAGYGEGGLVAFYAAAVDPRIQAAMVSGYFKSRQQAWEEPLYRDVWGLLREFGDAEIATLIAPRALVVEYRAEPAVSGPPPPKEGRKSEAAPGKLTTPAFAEVETEFQRIDSLVPPSFQPRRLVRGEDREQACAIFSHMLGGPAQLRPVTDRAADRRQTIDPAARQLRQVKELGAHVQLLVRDSDRTRDAFFLHKVLSDFANVPWNYNLTFPQKSPEAFTAAAKEYRQIFWDDILGRLDDPLPLPNPRTRLIYDEPKWRGYEVVLDTGGEGFAWGVLLVPKDLRPGERRPVVVCQHGRHGIPSDVITGDKPAYHNFAARLAEQGFITLAPHNLYQKEDYYRTLARKGHTVQATHWSVILRHHQQWLAWLASLPQVDPQRIGFYGLSFGGESAMRLPPLLDGYALSICSGDFNDWTRKVASTHDRKSFMFTDEWEIGCFNMGNTFSYAELSYLIFPRPFMVERGHHDQVALDPWVASEYAKTRWFYDQFGLGDRTAIEFFNGGHTINGQGTFEFLHKHLNWPEASK
ncbi:MAG: dienelactone hydrolase family protein [Chthoniobacter sp.]|nr:dienelactone hydrolase family protein [Chthoniobacter sp.]